MQLVELAGPGRFGGLGRGPWDWHGSVLGAPGAGKARKYEGETWSARALLGYTPLICPASCFLALILIFVSPQEWRYFSCARLPGPQGRLGHRFCAQISAWRARQWRPASPFLGFRRRVTAHSVIHDPAAEVVLLGRSSSLGRRQFAPAMPCGHGRRKTSILPAAVCVCEAAVAGRDCLSWLFCLAGVKFKPPPRLCCEYTRRAFACWWHAAYSFPLGGRLLPWPWRPA